MKQVVVTGASGVIGSVIIGGLSGFELVPFDLPRNDVLRTGDLDAALTTATYVVHLAWNSETENFRSDILDPANATMMYNVMRRSLYHGVKRVVLASSIHADEYPNPGRGELFTAASVGIPDSVYGADKLFGEAMGRHYSTRGLEVISLRFGGVNRSNSQPRDDRTERAVWLSHRDCTDLIQKCLDADVVPENYVCIYAVSNNLGRWHDFSNPFGWTPRDGDYSLYSADSDYIG